MEHVVNVRNAINHRRDGEAIVDRGASHSDLAGDYFVGTKEACRFRKCCRVTLWREVQAGRFPRPVKLGGRTLWSYREIQTWLAERLAERERAERIEE